MTTTPNFTIEEIRKRFHLREENYSIPLGYTCAAVLLPLLCVDNQLSLIFTKRTGTVRDHQNQISFPGGVCEASDKTLMETALREVKEEIGLTIPNHAVIGNLKPRRTITRYYVAPYIAFIESGMKIQSNPAEVLKIIVVPISWLSDQNNFNIRLYERPGFRMHDVVFFEPFDGEVIWGITAQIVLDFIEQIKK